MSFYKPRGGRNPWRGPSHSKPSQGPRPQEGSSQGPIRTPPAPPSGALLERLTPDQFNEDTHDDGDRLEITDTKFLASYNWTDAKAPSIIFPGKSQRIRTSKSTSSTITDHFPKGMPALWKPRTEATQLPQDSGKYFKDPNSARHPSHPMEPAVKAVLTQHPHFDTENVDLFGCTSTIGSLLRFLKNHDKPFRFAVEAVGRTVFFVRRENAPDELIAGPRGFGPTGHGTLIRYFLYFSWSSGADSCRPYFPWSVHALAGWRRRFRLTPAHHLI